MSTANTPEAPQPEFNTLTEEYEYAVAKFAKEFITPEELAKERVFMDFLAEKIPVKSHALEIIKKEATRDFLVSEFLSQYKKSETPKEPVPVFTAEELLKKIGYSLSNPTTIEKILEFTPFYKKGEVICTMNEAKGRLDRNYVFFLTHKNAANIPHANDLDKNNLTPEWEQYFKRNGITDINGIRPKSEDPYANSVFSVQIDRQTGTVLKIINRYNHSVKASDFTFGGNLNKLIPELEQAIYNRTLFEKSPAWQQKELPENIIEVKGKFYYYAQERQGVYWGDGFVYANGKVTVVDSSSERVVDGYILSSKKREQAPLQKDSQDPSPFPEGCREPYLEGIQQVDFPSKDMIEVLDRQGKKATLKTKDGCLISFHSDELTEMVDEFLRYNRTLESLTAPKLKTAGNNCLRYNESLTSLSCDNLEEVKDYFFFSNNSLISLSLNSLKKVGDFFFSSNNSLIFLSLNSLKKAGNFFFSSNNSLISLSLDNLKEVKDGFFSSNNSIISLSLNSLKKVGCRFFGSNNSIISRSRGYLNGAKDEFYYHERIKHLFPKAFSDGICTSRRKKGELKNVQTQEIRETMPSKAPSSVTGFLNGQGNLINEGKANGNASEK